MSSGGEGGCCVDERCGRTKAWRGKGVEHLSFSILFLCFALVFFFCFCECIGVVMITYGRRALGAFVLIDGLVDRLTDWLVD